MCGIFGYVGEKKVLPITLKGIQSLEYRGYDSCGISGIFGDGTLVNCKTKGNISCLKKEIKKLKIPLKNAIAHTRWATHGIPSKKNAHPHFDQNKTLSLVHNGIIENYELLRRNLEKKGVRFLSDTDTEVISHLIAQAYQGNIFKALQKIIPLLEGSFAIAIIHKDFPNQIFAVSHQSPLVIGLGSKEAFVASDPHAFSSYTKKVVYLTKGEIASISPEKLEIYNLSMEKIVKPSENIVCTTLKTSKGNFTHFTLKEIFEQPQAIRNTLLSRILQEYGNTTFEEFNTSSFGFPDCKKILLLGCGTSLHTALFGQYLFEDLARIETHAEIASEFRYKNPIISNDLLAIAISQSGETADTLAAVQQLKEKGATTLSLTNVLASTLSREAENTLYLRAGPEIGVCSTKTFSSSITLLSLLAIHLARQKNVSKQEGKTLIQDLLEMPKIVQKVLDHVATIEKLAKKYCHYKNFLYLGRRYMYPAALEGALKIKEIAYVNAQAFPGGEMKHGPIALVDPQCLTVCFLANEQTQEKMISNLMEIKARKGKILCIAKKNQTAIKEIADDIIWIPQTLDYFSIIPSTIVAQLFAYFIAKQNKTNIDQPRNLAKCVTVE